LSAWAKFTGWIDSFPWWAVALASFFAGALLGLVLRRRRRSKYESQQP
jgi:hypothetical protein